jgi:hypothetical protein
MAIEVLQGKEHTYRHDLKSLFYVFIWICIRYGSEHVINHEESRSQPNNRRVRLAYCEVGILGPMQKLPIRNGVT